MGGLRYNAIKEVMLRIKNGLNVCLLFFTDVFQLGTELKGVASPRKSSQSKVQVRFPFILHRRPKVGTLDCWKVTMRFAVCMHIGIKDHCELAGLTHATSRRDIEIVTWLNMVVLHWIIMSPRLRNVF